MSNRYNASYAAKATGALPAYKIEEQLQREEAKHCERWSDIETAAEYAGDVDTMSAFLMAHHNKKATEAQEKQIHSILQSAFEQHGALTGHKDFNTLLGHFSIGAKATSSPQKQAMAKVKKQTVNGFRQLGLLFA
jgi:hypothetical protein